LKVIYAVYDYLEEGDQYGLLERLNATSILLHTKTGRINEVLFRAMVVGRCLFDRGVFVAQTGQKIMAVLKKMGFKVVFLNHGWGTKCSPSRLVSKNRSELENFRLLRMYTDYVICYSDFDKTYFLRHPLLDDLPMPEFVPLGHPRNDFLVKNKDNIGYKSEVRKKLGVPTGAKVILIAPTFRDIPDYNVEVLNLYIRELEKLQRYLNESVYVLYRPHYHSVGLENQNWNNIIVCDSNRFPDPRPLMLASDLLVTDYSSIFVDYLLTDRPVAFFQPDIEKYQEVRGLVIDPDNKVHMPGPKLKSLKEILELSEKDFAEYDLEVSKKFFHKFTDGGATERVASFINNLLRTI
jgi:CDP-glycerol glycerophosphotransferase (TagB/SpsB family)